MTESIYKLRRYTKREHYADVTVRVEEIQSAGPLLSVSPDAFAWLADVYGAEAWEWSVCDEYRLAALQGVIYALTHASAPLTHLSLALTVISIDARPPFTSAGDVTYAACFATWDACGLQAAQEPQIVAGEVIFPFTS